MRGKIETNSDSEWYCRRQTDSGESSTSSTKVVFQVCWRSNVQRIGIPTLVQPDNLNIIDLKASAARVLLGRTRGEHPSTGRTVVLVCRWSVPRRQTCFNFIHQTSLSSSPTPSRNCQRRKTAKRRGRRHEYDLTRPTAAIQRIVIIGCWGSESVKRWLQLMIWLRNHSRSTAVRVPFDCSSTALRPFDVTTVGLLVCRWAAALRLNK